MLRLQHGDSDAGTHWSDATKNHFRNSRVELLKGLRIRSTKRIAHLSRDDRKGNGTSSSKCRSPISSTLSRRSALRPELSRRLADAPDTVFAEYDLDPEQRELATRITACFPYDRLSGHVDSDPPNHYGRPPACAEAPVQNDSRLLPDAQMALTVLPCLVGDRIAYAAWIGPLHESGDPSRVYARRAPHCQASPHPAARCHSTRRAIERRHRKPASQHGRRLAKARIRPRRAPWKPPQIRDASPFGSPLDSPDVKAAAAAVHAADPADRYEKLVALTHTYAPRRRR